MRLNARKRQLHPTDSHLLLQRASLETDEYFDPKKVRVRMGNTFLSAWTHIAQNEHKLTLPILIHYSTIDKVPKSSPPFRPIPLPLVHRYCSMPGLTSMFCPAAATASVVLVSKEQRVFFLSRGPIEGGTSVWCVCSHLRAFVCLAGGVSACNGALCQECCQQGCHHQTFRQVRT